MAGTLKEEALKLKQNLDTLYEGGPALGYRAAVEKICPTITKSGNVVVVSDFVEGGPLTVTAEEGTTITRCGTNLCTVDSLTLTGADPEKILWHGRISAPIRIRIFLDGLTNRGTAGAALASYVLDGATKYITVASEGLLRIDSGTLTRLAVINWSASVGTIRIMMVLGTTMPWTFIPYRGDTFEYGQEISALSGVNTLYANSGAITVTGAYDPVEHLCPDFTKTGSIVTCEPVEGYPLTVTAEEGAIIHRCGKNLLNLAGRTAVTYNTWETTAKRSLNGKKAFIGITTQNNFLGTNIASYTLTETGATFTAKQMGYCIGFDIPVSPNVWYNATCAEGYSLGIIFYTRDGAFIEAKTGQPALALAPANAAWAMIILPPTKANTEISFTNVRAWVGTMTEFEPYRGDMYTYTSGLEVPGLPGVNTLYANTGDTTVSGKADPIAIIAKLEAAAASAEA